MSLLLAEQERDLRSLENPDQYSVHECLFMGVTYLHVTGEIPELSDSPKVT